MLLDGGSSFIGLDDDGQGNVDYVVGVGDKSSGNYTIAGLLRQAFQFPGGLREAGFGGIQYGTDAAGADAYATVMTVVAESTNMAVAVTTNGAVISIDGGSTEAFAVLAAAPMQFRGVVIPAGAVIQARNENAANNYARLHITIW